MQNSAASAAASLKHEAPDLSAYACQQNSAASAAASLKQPSDGWLLPTILLKFRGICRGLIEAIWVREKIARRAENSAASAAASLKLDRRLRVPVRTGKIPRHLPRPH